MGRYGWHFGVFALLVLCFLLATPTLASHDGGGQHDDAVFNSSDEETEEPPNKGYNRPLRRNQDESHESILTLSEALDFVYLSTDAGIRLSGPEEQYALRDVISESFEDIFQIVRTTDGVVYHPNSPPGENSRYLNDAHVTFVGIPGAATVRGRGAATGTGEISYTIPRNGRVYQYVDFETESHDDCHTENDTRICTSETVSIDTISHRTTIAGETFREQNSGKTVQIPYGMSTETGDGQVTLRTEADVTFTVSTTTERYEWVEENDTDEGGSETNGTDESGGGDEESGSEESEESTDEMQETVDDESAGGIVAYLDGAEGEEGGENREQEESGGQEESGEQETGGEQEQEEESGEDGDSTEDSDDSESSGSYVLQEETHSTETLTQTYSDVRAVHAFPGPSLEPTQTVYEYPNGETEVQLRFDGMSSAGEGPRNTLWSVAEFDSDRIITNIWRAYSEYEQIELDAGEFQRQQVGRVTVPKITVVPYAESPELIGGFGEVEFSEPIQVSTQLAIDPDISIELSDGSTTYRTYFIRGTSQDATITQLHGMGGSDLDIETEYVSVRETNLDGEFTGDGRVEFTLTTVDGTPIEGEPIHIGNQNRATFITDSEGAVTTTVEGSSVEAQYRGTTLPNSENEIAYASSQASAIKPTTTAWSSLFSIAMSDAARAGLVCLLLGLFWWVARQF